MKIYVSLTKNSSKKSLKNSLIKITFSFTNKFPDAGRI